MKNLFELLQDCSTIADLRPLLKAICLGFGTITRLDMLMASQAGNKQALCFIRMASAQQEDSLMRELGVGRFGGDIVVIVNLRGQTTQAPGASATAAVHSGGDSLVFQATLPIAASADWASAEARFEADACCAAPAGNAGWRRGASADMQALGQHSPQAATLGIQ